MRNVAAEQGDVRYLVPMKQSRAGSDGRAARCAHGDLTKRDLQEAQTALCRSGDRVCARRQQSGRVCRCSWLGQEPFIVSLTSDKNRQKRSQGTDDPLVRHCSSRYLCRVLCRASCSTL
jgi:hypothetical protein